MAPAGAAMPAITTDSRGTKRSVGNGYTNDISDDEVYVASTAAQFLTEEEEVEILAIEARTEHHPDAPTTEVR